MLNYSHTFFSQSLLHWTSYIAEVAWFWFETFRRNLVRFLRDLQKVSVKRLGTPRPWKDPLEDSKLLVWPCIVHVRLPINSQLWRFYTIIWSTHARGKTGDNSAKWDFKWGPSIILHVYQYNPKCIPHHKGWCIIFANKRFELGLILPPKNISKVTFFWISKINFSIFFINISWTRALTKNIRANLKTSKFYLKNGILEIKIGSVFAEILVADGNYASPFTTVFQRQSWNERFEPRSNSNFKRKGRKKGWRKAEVKISWREQ